MNFLKPATILAYCFPVYRKFSQWIPFYMGCLKVLIPHPEQTTSIKIFWGILTLVSTSSKLSAFETYHLYVYTLFLSKNKLIQNVSTILYAPHLQFLCQCYESVMEFRLRTLLMHLNTSSNLRGTTSWHMWANDKAMKQVFNTTHCNCLTILFHFQ